jgi:rhamnosyltransferase
VLANLEAIRRQVQRVIVVDNGSTTGSQALLAPFAGHPAVELVLNSENRGIAAALNQGVERALAGNFDWVATFDQDSKVPGGFITGLLAACAAYAERGRIAVLAPLYHDPNLDFIYSPSRRLTEDRTTDVAVSVTATSGNLVAARALRAHGGFREDFFIDCVDFEFCLRYRQKGWLVLEVPRVVLEHEAGSWQQRRWLWKQPRVNDYNAVRRYYQARNRLVMYARFAWFDPRWTLRDAWGYACDLVKLFLFGENRWSKLRAILTGCWHAITGRRGRWQPGP